MKRLLKKLIVSERLVEENSSVECVDKQNVNTSVAYFYEKYRTGKIEDLPRTKLTELPPDGRTDDEMLGDEFIPGLGTDQLDVLTHYKEVRDRLDAELADLKLSQKRKKELEEALQVLDSTNATPSERVKAYQKIESIKANARVRD